MVFPLDTLHDIWPTASGSLADPAHGGLSRWIAIVGGVFDLFPFKQLCHLESLTIPTPGYIDTSYGFTRISGRGH